MAVERAAGGTSLIDVLDRVLDKGIVIDAWVRVSLVGIDLITVEARVGVASIDTYLKYSEAVGQVGPMSRPQAELTAHQNVVAENVALRAELAAIKAARSVSDVGEFKAHRGQLIKDGKPLGGSFKAGAGETVYIGHFFLSCHAGPVLWRYYWDGPDPFEKYLGEIKEKYPFLDLSKVQFKLFRTTQFGNDELHDGTVKLTF